MEAEIYSFPACKAYKAHLPRGWRERGKHTHTHTHTQRDRVGYAISLQVLSSLWLCVDSLIWYGKTSKPHGEPPESEISSFTSLLEKKGPQPKPCRIHIAEMAEGRQFWTFGFRKFLIHLLEVGHILTTHMNIFQSLQKMHLWWPHSQL